jgi:hypothetical protein
MASWHKNATLIICSTIAFVAAMHYLPTPHSKLLYTIISPLPLFGISIGLIGLIMKEYGLKALIAQMHLEGSKATIINIITLVSFILYLLLVLCTHMQVNQVVD